MWIEGAGDSLEASAGVCVARGGLLCVAVVVCTASDAVGLFGASAGAVGGSPV